MASTSEPTEPPELSGVKRDAEDAGFADAIAAASAAAKRVASKFDVKDGDDGDAPAASAAPPPLAGGAIADLLAQPAASSSAALIDAVVAANPACVDGPEPLLDFDAAPVTLKLHAHLDVVAALLSHEGATLGNIRTSAGCRVQLLPASPADPANRTLQLGGTQEAVCAALGYVLAEMQKSCANNPAVMSAAGYTVRILVRSDACGSIIGKGGTVIAQIRQTSGCVVKMDQADASVDPFPQVSPRGPCAAHLPAPPPPPRPCRARALDPAGRATPPPSALLPSAHHLALCAACVLSTRSRARCPSTAASPSAGSCPTCTWRCSTWCRASPATRASGATSS